MTVRNATESDLSEILVIYAKAREFMKKTGNPTQWAGGYPKETLLREDIATGTLYVIEKTGEIHGVFAFFPEGDPLYDALPVSWRNDLPYAAIHRVASAGTEKGVLRACIDFCLTLSKNLKIDTHKDNLVMQSALQKLGFESCGIAVIPDVGERIVYQRFEGEKELS